MRIATEVSTYDEEVREFWMTMVGRFIEGTADHIRAHQQQGRIASELDPLATAEALVWMAERCCYIYLGRGDRTAAEVTEALTAAWVAALYG